MAFVSVFYSVTRFGEILNLLWQKFYSIGRIIIIVNDQIMKKII